jgi:hypothetical protein
MKPRILFAFLALFVVGRAFSAEHETTDQDDPFGRKISERIGPFVQLSFLPNLRYAYRGDKNLQAWTARYQHLTVEEKVRYCICQLRNETWLEFDQNLNDEPYSSEPEGTPTCELIKLGRSAIPQLLSALESRVQTGMRYSRFNDEKYVVQDAAIEIIEEITCRYFSKTRPLSIQDPEDRHKCRAKVIQWWHTHKDSDEIQWAKDILLAEKAVEGERRGTAIDSLYLRLGKSSYPYLVKAYEQLPHTGAKADAGWLRPQILQWLAKSPTAAEKPVFASAIQDSDLCMLIPAAEGLRKLGDLSGVEAVVKYTEDRMRIEAESGPLYESDHGARYDNLISDLLRFDTAHSRNAIYKCLSGRNPYLRVAAVHVCTALRMENAIRALPELFDDTFVLREGREPADKSAGGGYASYGAGPAWRICDEAAFKFTGVVPDAPKYDGTTAKMQRLSIQKLKQWWTDNRQNLVWNEKRAVLELPKQAK